MRPAVFQVGGVVYWTLLTRNPDTGVLKDADSTPTVAVRKNGSSVADSVTVTKRSATTGIYDCSYNPAGEVEGDAFTLEESATVTGTTTSSATYNFAWNVRCVAVERGTDSAALASGVNVTQLGGDAQSLADLKDFADAGYDPTANAVTAVLDSATQTQITAIETFATRITTGIVQDGAVWQFTANMLELGPGGGSSTVTVLPATGIVANRSAGTTLNPVVGETISQAITVYQSDGTTAVDLSGKSLKVIFETMNGTDVAVVNTADITVSGADDNVVTFAYPSAVTASERTLRFAIRDASAPLTMYLQGVCSVVSAPKVDA